MYLSRHELSATARHGYVNKATTGVRAGLGCIAVLSGFGASSAAYSQSPASDDTLQEIVVTAEHRETNLQKTAVSVAVLSADDLRAQAKETLGDALRSVPSVAVRDDATGPTVVIRGIQPVFGTDPTVNINVDGVYQAQAGALATFDLKRIEVLKGPQGTLFGRNADAGVVNFINNTPGSKFGGTVLMQYGNYDSVRMESAVDLPISDRIQTRTAALYSSHNGYLSNGSDDEDTRALREKIRLIATDDLSFLITGDYAHFGGHGPGNVPAPLAAHSSNPWYTEVDPGLRDWTNQAINLEADWDLHWAKLFFQSAYQDFRQHNDSDLTPSTGFANGATVDINASYELRLSSEPSSPITWQAGVYRLDDKSTTIPFPAELLPLETHPLASTIIGGPTTEKSNAIFGQVTYPITDTFRATVGLRYTKDEVGQITDVYSTATQSLQNAYPGSGSFPSTTYKVALEKDLTPTSLLYANVSKGFKAGGLNAAGVTPATYKPETVLAYELGSKNELFDRTLRLNADVYYDDYTDKQTQVVSACDPTAVPTTCPFPNLVNLNAAKATLYGAELQSDWAPSRSDTLSATVAYNHSRFDKLIFTVLNGLTVENIDRSGAQLPNAPEWTETLSYQHTFHIAEATLSASGNVLFASGDDTDPNFNQPDQYQHAYNLVGANLRYSPDNASWSIGAYGNNLTNEVVRQRSYTDNRLWLMPPRTYGINADVKF